MADKSALSKNRVLCEKGLAVGQPGITILGINVARLFNSTEYFSEDPTTENKML